MIFHKILIPYESIVDSRNSLVYLHAYMFVILVFSQIEAIRMEGLKMGLSFFGIIFSIYVLVNVAYVNMYTPDPDSCREHKSALFIIWEQIEILTNFGFVFANIIFLALRGCFKHKVRIDAVVSDEMKFPEMDTLTALQRLSMNFTNECVPAIVAIILFYNPSTKSFKQDNIMEMQLLVTVISSIIGLFFCTFTIFV